MYLVVCTYPNFSIIAKCFREPYLQSKGSIYNLQAENIMNFMWECLQIAVFFTKFPGGEACPQAPLVPACFCCEVHVLCTPLPKRLVP